MPLAVASRFAVLRIDDDPDERPKPNPKNQNKVTDGKKSDSKKKNKPDGKVNQTQNVKSKGSTTTQQKKKKAPGPTAEQWDQWQRKDAEVADGNYETDLHQAILLSKVDFEKNKDVYDQRKKAAEAEKKLGLPGKKSKKSKPQPMSLDQFNNLQKENQETEVEHSTMNGNSNGCASGGEEEFFERIKDEAKEALQREESLALKKLRAPDIYEAITQAQYEDSLEKKDGQISTLTDEIVRLKEDLHNVKTRNKKLCQILANGEMKDKAQLLVELDKMHRVKDELSSEVSSLHIQLEQERSKNHVLTTDPKNKSQSKKRGTSESTQQ